MFNKNVFTQKDNIADLVKPMLEAQAKAKMEELKGQQHKIDKNKNNRIDAQDFKILRGEKKVNEEEQVEEGWDDMMKAVKDRSGPQPSGGAGVKAGRAYGGAAQKSKPEHDDADDKKKTQKEEVEQIDELSRKTLSSYVKKAYTSGTDANLKLGYKAGRKEDGDEHATTANKRSDGINRAANKLAKEDVEQIEERELSKGETAEKERIVKGMKKGLAGFKARYGDRAKSVMYATATKQAKKD